MAVLKLDGAHHAGIVSSANLDSRRRSNSSLGRVQRQPKAENHIVAIGCGPEIGITPPNASFAAGAAMHALVNPRRFSWQPRLHSARCRKELNVDWPPSCPPTWSVIRALQVWTKQVPDHEHRNHI